MNLSGRTKLQDSCARIDHALAAAINFLDTANAYGNGASEEVVGEALQRNGHRDFVCLASKCHGNVSRPTTATTGQPPSARSSTPTDS